MDGGLLERVWEYREEILYRRLFGDAARGIFAIPYEMFAETFSQAEVDPRWLHYGVFEYAPISTRSSWVYATSGMSTPWEVEDVDPSAPQAQANETRLKRFWMLPSACAFNRHADWTPTGLASHCLEERGVRNSRSMLDAGLQSNWPCAIRLRVRLAPAHPGMLQSHCPTNRTNSFMMRRRW